MKTNFCCWLLLVALFSLVEIHSASRYVPEQEDDNTFRPYYRKLPRLPPRYLALLKHQQEKRESWFDRGDRDYKGLMFGKRADYVNTPFG